MSFSGSRISFILFLNSWQHLTQCLKHQRSTINSAWMKELMTMNSYTQHFSSTEWVNWTELDYTIYGILQARILEWVSFPFSRGSSQPRDWTQVSLNGGGFLTSWAIREAQEYWSGYVNGVALNIQTRGTSLAVVKTMDLQCQGTKIPHGKAK